MSHFDWHVSFVAVQAGWPVYTECVMWRSLSRSLSVVPRLPGSEDVPSVRSWAPRAVWSTPTTILEHIETNSDNWDRRRERREGSSVSMWTSSGYPLGRASVKLVFIENCQMVICKYLCKKFWKLCNSIYRNIVKSLLHITYISFHF